MGISRLAAVRGAAVVWSGARGAGVRWARAGGAAFALAGLLLSACTDAVPTSSDPALIPVDAETFVVELPFSAFADAFRNDGGYGSARDLPAGILARGGTETDPGDGGTTLPAISRVLLQWGPFPGAINILPSEGGAGINDTAWTVVGGELILRIDSARFSGGDLFDIDAFAMTEGFDPGTASWTLAVDTLGNRRSWTIPGGGPLAPMGGVSWEPALGDSLVIPIDSAVAAALGDRTQPQRGVAIETRTPEAYLRLFDGRLRLQVRPASRPDTTVALQPDGLEITTIQSTPVPTGDAWMLVGGAPAYRSSFRLRPPAQVEASGPACGGPPTCLVDLTPERVVFASLVLTTLPSPSATLAPADTLSLDLRPVLAPELLPRAPLGVPAQQLPRRIAPVAFTPDGTREFEIGFTRFFRDVVRPDDPDRDPVPRTLSLVTATEPATFGIGTFAGPGSATPPRLRLILTRSEGVSIP